MVMLHYNLHIKLKGIRYAATWLQIFCLQTPYPPDPGDRVKSHGHVAYQIKGNQVCSNRVANILPATPGSKGQFSTFSEHGHVAYKIKGNNKCSNMVANVLPTNTYPATKCQD